MYEMHSRNFKNKEHNTETNKGTQTGLKQTPKWNKGHYKKKDTWIKEDHTNYKRGVEQRYGKLQKKESNRSPGNTKTLWLNKKHTGSPL
jgi:hypothetical protein